MLPSEDDVLLIDRDVLEGRKEAVKPDIKPEPEVKVDNEASIAALKEALITVVRIVDGQLAEDTTVNAEIEFDHCDADLFYEMWESLDAESVRACINEAGGNRLCLKYEGVMSKRIDSVFESMAAYGNADGAQVSGFESNYAVALETDAETGDTKVVPVIYGFEFTGKVIVNYPVQE